MLSCVKNRKRLGAYLDGELSGGEKASVERHLQRCESCRSVLSDLKKLEPLLFTVEVPSVPDNLISRIRAVARGRQKQRIGASTSGWWWRAWAAQPWATKNATVAALILGLAMGTYMGLTSYRDGDPAQQRPTASKNEPLYALDALSAAPEGSIEAATLALLENGR